MNRLRGLFSRLFVAIGAAVSFLGSKLSAAAGAIARPFRRSRAREKEAGSPDAPMTDFLELPEKEKKPAKERSHGSGTRVKEALGGRSARRVFTISLAVIAAVAFILSITSAIYAEATHFDAFSDHPFRVDMSEQARKELGPIVDAYASANKDVVLAKDGQDAEIVISEKKLSGYRVSAIEMSPGVKVEAGSKTLTLAPGRKYYFMSRDFGLLNEATEPGIDSLETSIRTILAGRPVSTMTAVGDILPGRHVVEKMNQYGVDYPFKKIAPAVKGSDITYGDLECPVTDRIEPPTSGMLFSAPKKTIEGLKLLGLDVVSVANNHTTNFGVEPFVDTLKLLQDNKIAYTGGGYNYDQAHTPAILDAGGMKMSFLAYDSIPDVIKAGSGPGVAWLSLPPWNPMNPEELDQVLSDIRAAKAKSVYVVACFHWSAEDVYYPSAAMKDVAYKAIDAGADMVLGSHPHTIQPIEYHDGHLIVYSMGNFVFDQMQRDQTREGFFIKCTFLSGELTKVKLVPYKIRDYSQPVVQTGTAGQKILNKVLKLSGK